MAGKRVTPKQSLSEANQEQRDKINAVEQTVREVIVPQLNDLKAGQQLLISKDYLTTADAKSTYMTLEAFRPYKIFISIIGGALLTGIGIALANFLLSGALK